MNEEQQQKYARARRLKILRALTGKNQLEFAKLCHISSASIALWETAQYNGLSYKGAQLIVHAMEEVGVCCHLHWLWSGIGNAPTPNAAKKNKRKNLFNQQFAKIKDQIHAIQKETELFLSLVPNSVILEIVDDAMKDFQLNDFVGAVWTPDAAHKNSDKDKVVQLQDGRMLVRRMGYDEPNKNNFLYATNFKSQAPDLIIVNPEIQKIGHIIRLWRVFL
jgi:hypothetical protein